MDLKYVTHIPGYRVGRPTEGTVLATPGESTRTDTTAKGFWRAVAKDLRDHPNSWALFEGEPSVYGHNINKGVWPAFHPVGTYEAVTRNNKVDANGTKRCDLYVRSVL